MARNRKRAKERRARRPESVAAARARREQSAPSPISHATPDVELAEAQLEVGRPDAADEADERPESLGAAEDRADEADGRRQLLDEAETAEPAELSDEGDERPEVLDEADSELLDADDRGSELVDEVDAEAEEADEYDDLESEAVPAGPEDGRARPGGDGSTSAGAGALTARGTAVPERRPWVGGRFLHFLQGSWRELQRVQWPDRRQVMQATGVVIGFVIVAGVFLGVADWAAGKIVTYILK